METPRLSYDECLERAKLARAQAARAAAAEVEAEYTEIAKMWDDLCASMRKNGLMEVAAPAQKEN